MSRLGPVPVSLTLSISSWAYLETAEFKWNVWAEDFRQTATEYCTARHHSVVIGPQAVLHNGHGYAYNV